MGFSEVDSALESLFGKESAFNKSDNKPYPKRDTGILEEEKKPTFLSHFVYNQGNESVYTTTIAS